MEYLHLILLGLIQGITEFLPISSSAHLILLPHFMGWQDQGIAYDIAAHLGSLAAVVLYFRKDLYTIMAPWLHSPGSFSHSSEHKPLLFITLATLPIAMVGYLFYDLISTYLRGTFVIAVASIVFGIVLWWADATGKRVRSFQQLNYSSIFMIGFAQALALIPGTSRSGITMTAGLLLGYDRQTAARFSFLLAIPTILLAGGHEAFRYFAGVSETNWLEFAIVAVVSAISAYIAIHYFLKFLEKTGMLPYVIYRIVLGILLIVIFGVN